MYLYFKHFKFAMSTFVVLKLNNNFILVHKKYSSQKHLRLVFGFPQKICIYSILFITFNIISDSNQLLVVPTTVSVR